MDSSERTLESALDSKVPWQYVPLTSLATLNISEDRMIIIVKKEEAIIYSGQN